MTSFKTTLYLYIGVGVVILIVFSVFLSFLGILPGRKPAQPPSATLKFWGFKDTDEAWRDIIRKFKDNYPYISIQYQTIDEGTYEDTLVNKLAEGTGPDIFLLKDDWLEKHRDKIVPLPQDKLNYTVNNFRNEFVDLAVNGLTNQDGSIVGIPLFVDTLALFYDKDAFNAAGIAEPPSTWSQVLQLTPLFVKKTPSGDILKSGMALGTYKNVSHALEILSAMIFQNGDDIVSRKNNEIAITAGAENALSLYISFADSSKTNFSWSGRLENSINALANGNAVMAIGYFNDVQNLLAQNPHLNLGAALFPQAKDAKFPITYGNYVFATVSKQSLHPDYAWQFILYITSKDVSGQYLDKTNRSPARRDIIQKGTVAPYSDMFYRQALFAKNWPIPKDHEGVRKIFQDTIESILSKSANIPQAAVFLREKLRFITR